MSLEEIETAISRLSAEEVAKLTAWLTEFNARDWDRRIERDLEAGRLDEILSVVDKEYQAGLAKPL